MTEKRFKCHQMIADYTTREDIDFDFLQELINEQEQPLDLRMHISEGNKILTYRECVDLLNALDTEKEELKHKVHKYSLQIIAMDNRITELEKENQRLKEAIGNLIVKEFKITKEDIIKGKGGDATDFSSVIDEFFNNEVSISEIQVELKGEKTMTDNIHKDCENYNPKKDYCLKWFETEVSKKYKVCREYSEFSDKELSRKWSN